MTWKTRFTRIYDIRPSVRHSSVRPSVRHSSVCPYPRFILTPARRVWRSFKFAPFLGFFSLSKVGLPLMGDSAVQYTDCYLSPCQHDFLNSISTGICRQNTQFNMYSTTSKHQEGCTFKDSHAKCLITTNFDKFHREAVAKGAERGKVLTACFRDKQSQRSIRMAFVIIMILFDVMDYRSLYIVRHCSIRVRRKYKHDSQDFLRMFIS